jgi:hypothetical protein
VQTGESYLGCHIHVNTLVSRRNQPEAGGCDCDNQGADGEAASSNCLL